MTPPPPTPTTDKASLFVLAAALSLRNLGCTGNPHELIFEHGTADISASTLDAMQAALNKTGNPASKATLEEWQETLSKEAIA